MTVEQVVYDHIKTDTDMTAIFKGVFYILNDNKALPPYAVLWVIDDPEDRETLCTSQGQARFQCEVYVKRYSDGLEYRKTYKEVMKKLNGTETSGIKINYVDNVNSSDNPANSAGLYAFTFESVVNWEQS